MSQTWATVKHQIRFLLFFLFFFCCFLIICQCKSFFFHIAVVHLVPFLFKWQRKQLWRHLTQWRWSAAVNDKLAFAFRKKVASGNLYPAINYSKAVPALTYRTVHTQKQRRGFQFCSPFLASVNFAWKTTPTICYFRNMNSQPEVGVSKTGIYWNQVCVVVWAVDAG